MATDQQDVTDAELAVLQTLWAKGSATIRELTDILYPRGTNAHYATVQKLLGRLESKKCVKRDRSFWPHVYQATVDREELMSRRLRVMAEKLRYGSLAPLLTHLVRTKRLNAEEQQALRELLSELDQE
jgi:BlaI family penicillinase repressor